MSEPVKDYYKMGNEQNPNSNPNFDYNYPNQNQNLNMNINYGMPPPPPQYNQNQDQQNMAYNGQAPPQPYIGQPIGQPIMVPPQMHHHNDQGMQQPQYGLPPQPPQMIAPQNQQNIYNQSSGSNQFNQSQQSAQYPLQQPGQYQPPGYAQGVPIEAQIIRVQGVQNPPQNMITNLDHCEMPTAFRCNFCQKESVSTMTVEPGTGTWMACCCLCCCFGVFGLIPFCSDSCQDKKHFCPFCGAQVGFKEFKPC